MMPRAPAPIISFDLAALEGTVAQINGGYRNPARRAEKSERPRRGKKA